MYSPGKRGNYTSFSFRARKKDFWDRGSDVQSPEMGRWAEDETKKNFLIA